MLWSGFILGLLGSFHCMGMCGPIAFLLPVNHKNPTQKAFQVSIYHAGRLFAYGLIGFLLGLLGKSFDLFGWQQQLSIAVGVAMIVMVITTYFIGMNFTVTKPLYRLVGKLKSAMGKELKKKTYDAFFTMGFLNGLLPCGLVYMAVIGAVGSGNALEGAAYMMFFGLGTVPLMTAAVYLGNVISIKVKTFMKKAVPVFVILIGLLFIVRGLGLGIPYLSPKNMKNQQSAQQSCHTPIVLNTNQK
ncbi:heavy-metal-associated domain (N-terminus) and membrane-bounded cytochrome biogenesis CycZ-like domain [Nonlabens ulvanivorans]|nr:sulfite exporter TauE/SafE family protein [Nonlabens ulvanivorans]GAK93387.1 heavy-metal-associated domain (N-terminus) and membrane-bounded cytochrome biogenesis CycZ-like domain [Nonlabens ulvanivorans]